LTTRDTVAIDTPASAATSPMVIRSWAFLIAPVNLVDNDVENVYNRTYCVGGDAS
jgi:hypothetical protein